MTIVAKRIEALNSMVVSIHAPVKGATLTVSLTSLLTHVSIHAPVKGATKSRSTSVMPAAVSIHAPVKGATRVWLWLMYG